MKKILIYAFAMLIVTNVNCETALAFGDAGAINSNDVLDLRLHEIMKRKKNLAPTISKSELKQSEQVLQSDIKNVIFTNNASISTQELNNVVQNYINQPMSVQNVSAIQKEIMKYYQKKGYYSAVATISSENPQNGELVLNIKEGTKNSINIQP